MKDISTLRYEPQRLWEWAPMASEVTERYGEYQGARAIGTARPPSRVPTP